MARTLSLIVRNLLFTIVVPGLGGAWIPWWIVTRHGRAVTPAAWEAVPVIAAGTALYEGRSLAGMRPRAIVAAGLVQVPEGREVFARMTVRENLDLGAWLRKDRIAVARQIDETLERFPILADRRDELAGNLSGGEQQILAVARGLLAAPRLLLLDEPSLGLAPAIVDQVFEVIAGIHADGVAVLLVEQNARRALAMSHRGYVLDLGRNRFQGTGADLLHDPKVIDLYLGGTGRIDS